MAESLYSAITMNNFWYEFIGTAILITLGNGAVANVNLSKSGMKGGGSIQITIAWGFAVMIPAFIFGEYSGAIFNPALTLALAVDGSLAWSSVPSYMAAQFLGAFVGSCVVWVMFMDHFNATEDPNTIFGCFSTSPTIRNIPRNIFCEAVGAFMLVFAIKGIGQVEVASGLNMVYLFGIITSIGMSFGGLTGYAINPARDIGPRLAHQLLPIKNKGSSHWDYAAVPVLGPVIGSLAAVLLYGLMFN